MFITQDALSDARAFIADALPEGQSLDGLTNYGDFAVARIGGTGGLMGIIDLARAVGGTVTTTDEDGVNVAMWHIRIAGVAVAARWEFPYAHGDDEEEEPEVRD